MNLLEETIANLNEIGKTSDEIKFIGNTEGYSCTWDEFVNLANFDYDNGYGAAKIATDLIIVFNDNSVMSRGEYDGSEWWDYTPKFIMPKVKLPIKRLTYKNSFLSTLKEMHEI